MPDIPRQSGCVRGKELVPSSVVITGDWAFSANYSPDGSLIVSTGNDGTTIVWDVATGSELLTITDYSGDDAVFSPDGRHVIVTDNQEMVVVDLDSGEISDLVPGPGSSIAEMLFSPDGERLAASSFEFWVLMRSSTESVWWSWRFESVVSANVWPLKMPGAMKEVFEHPLATLARTWVVRSSSTVWRWCLVRDGKVVDYQFPASRIAAVRSSGEHNGSAFVDYRCCAMGDTGFEPVTSAI